MPETNFTLLYDILRAEKEFSAILDTYRMQRLERNPHPMLITGLAEGARDMFYAAMVSELRRLSPDKPVLCIPSDEKELLKRLEAGLMDGMIGEGFEDVDLTSQAMIKDGRPMLVKYPCL